MGLRAWFEEEGVGEGVRNFFRDTPEGRVEREEMLRGRGSTDWDLLPKELQVFKRMVQFKSGTGDTLEEREAMFGDVFRELSEEEWLGYWGKKSSRTSAGRTKVRPDMVKECGKELLDFMRRLYSVFLRLGVIPEQWKWAIIVAIEKITGNSRLDMLRPLKLLEVCQKAVLSIVKERIKIVIEMAGLFFWAQMGFRPGRSCPLAVMKIVSATEDAWQYNKDLHLVTLDIRKAYDCVIRTLGKEAGMRRIGIPLRVVEFFMEMDRNNRNSVRTFWDEFLEGTVEAFEAQRGFAQGAAESPLLWDIFYDMVLEELDRQGVGRDILIDIGGACAGGQGLGAFADDTSIMTGTVEEMQRALSVIALVLDLVLLRVAPEKSKHMALMWNRDKKGEEGTMCGDELLEQGIAHRVELGGTRIPWVEADVGVKHLGYWLDLHMDWGNQQDRIEQMIREFTEKVKPAKISKEILLYVVEAVLLPRVLYPLAVAGIRDDQIRKMEGRVLKWLLPKLGVHRTYSRDLLHSSISVGGLGWESWTLKALKVRTRLALDLRGHQETAVSTTSDGLRLGKFMITCQAEYN